MDFFNLHTHTFTNDPDVLELVNQYPWEFEDGIPFYSIGIHPWFIVEARLESDFEMIESKLEQPGCLAVGECGLDKRIEVPMELQQLVFEKQLLLAQRYQKPVVIHCVAAFQELIQTTKKLQITVPILIHGFSKSEALARQLLDQGFYISFGKYLLQNPELETVFKNMPNDRFFLETDTVAESLSTVYALAAKYKEITVEELQQQLSENFKKVFGTAL